MSQVINTNISSLNAQRQLLKSSNAMQTAMQRLSSGVRINSAKDDAAGLAIADRMTAQIKGLNQAARNANDGISIAQVAEGALGEVTNALQRMRELAVQSANDTNTATDRASLQKEVAQLQQEITRIATQTQFNGKNLLDGSFTSAKFQVGAYADQTISFSIGNSKATNIGSNSLTNTTGTAVEAAAASADKTALTALNRVAAQNLTVTGNIGSATLAVANNDSANAIATAVNNATASTGVTATALTKATLSGLAAAGTLTFNLYGSNSSAVAISANVSSTGDLTSLAEAINGAAASTGITAELDASRSSITLSQAEGYDIVIEDFLNSAGAGGTINFQGLNADTGATEGAAATLGAAVGTDSSKVVGTLMFSSASSYTVTTDTTGTLFSAATNASTLSAVGSINVGTQSGANSAIKSVDGALAFVDDLRATLGAVQNRFSSAVANMQATSQNISAARSRVFDADFAAETSELSRNQILQQAGTAMLAQANASTQNVLSLLRG
ncbi:MULTISPECIES: flagellin N-terminal helical domain-containing protein [Methylocaldum]|jgi:flagellin|uniref:flagellin N-terminal helical domain-containing protein n=1 Tax=unclassified Methylocaldum TaxID=2622260 RepID=UPI00098A7424|nr:MULTISPECIES: flagellin [unclassified Methylocaldum]MBP1151673.1 flagellin [Methylocaldum sp. RMAD-M]MVF21285.1 flagellin [Methylocaldum sp. BRCS4]